MGSSLAAAEKGVEGHPLWSPGELGEAWYQPTVQLSEAGERLRLLWKVTSPGGGWLSSTGRGLFASSRKSHPCFCAKLLATCQAGPMHVSPVTM